MNENCHVTIRPRKEKKWVLQEVEKMAVKEQRSISFMIIELLEKQLKSKPAKK